MYVPDDLPRATLSFTQQGYGCLLPIYIMVSADSCSFDLSQVQAQGFDGVCVAVSAVEADSKEMFVDCLRYYGLR